MAACSNLQGRMLASIYAGRLVVLDSRDCSQLPGASVSTSHIRAAFQGMGVLPCLAWGPSGRQIAVWGSCRRQPNPLHLYCTSSWTPVGTVGLPHTCLYNPVWGLHGVAAFTAEHGLVLLSADVHNSSAAFLGAQPVRHPVSQLPTSGSTLAFSPAGGFLAVITAGLSKQQVGVEVWAVNSQRWVAAWHTSTPLGASSPEFVVRWAAQAPCLHVAWQCVQQQRVSAVPASGGFNQWVLEFSRSKWHSIPSVG